ncbi:hypothetical protein N0B31_05215 [Salinirubellus salinus]|uniref:DUF8216 domain-containing protein n=1 Tax=Salinirubellus salinus TaxID=1364945 RepID=A0A9E7UCD5_9EURY|nr:hypothetical protein [Salinirubellus salinus]UWM55684.1 hypothetical protein N0B31_05215 [Salinirubellus salinus]
MAAPTLIDGIKRALVLLALPSAGVLALVGGVDVIYGGEVAGQAYLGAIAVILGGVYLAAKYWNIRYTVGFVGAGVVAVVGAPSFVSNLIPETYANAGTLLVLLFVVLVGMRLLDKMEG